MTQSNQWYIRQRNALGDMFQQQVPQPGHRYTSTRHRPGHTLTEGHCADYLGWWRYLQPPHLWVINATDRLPSNCAWTRNPPTGTCRCHQNLTYSSRQLAQRPRPSHPLHPYGASTTEQITSSFLRAHLADLLELAPTCYMYNFHGIDDQCDRQRRVVPHAEKLQSRHIATRPVTVQIYVQNVDPSPRTTLDRPLATLHTLHHHRVQDGATIWHYGDSWTFQATDNATLQSLDHWYLYVHTCILRYW